MVRPLRRIFRPHADIAAALQREFHLPRPPACRMNRSRFEIVVRGADLSRTPIDRCIALAEAISAAARPLLEQSHRYLARRSARFAIRVSFEDEEVVAAGIVTTRTSYMAMVGEAGDAAALSHPRHSR